MRRGAAEVPGLPAPAPLPLPGARGATHAPPAEVRTIGRALDLLLAFSPADRDLSARELGQRVGLHRSTAHRLATYLAARGFLRQDPATLGFRLGRRLVELGSLAVRQSDVRNTARPHLEALARLTGESVFLGVRDGDEAMHLDVVESSRPGFVLTVQPGRRVPLHSSASGKVLLAWLPRAEVEQVVEATGLPRFTAGTLTARDTLLANLEVIRAQGYGLDGEETQEGAVGIAAPIFDGSDAVVASLSLAGPPARIVGQMELLVREVRAAAAAISAELGSAGLPFQRVDVG